MRFWRWLTRRDIKADTERAVVALLLMWCGVALGGFVVIWSAVTRQWGGVMQGVALMVVGAAVMLSK